MLISPVVFLIAVAKALQGADTRIRREIPTHSVKIYSYVDDFNCTAREPEAPTPRRRGRKPDAITAARKARSIVSEELKAHGWSRDPDKDEEINFGSKGTAKWVGITFSHNFNWKTHCNRRLDQAEAAWACVSRLGTSRGGLSPTTWRQLYTSSIRAIATYGWELTSVANTTQETERLRKLQYKALRKITGGYHGSSQDLLEQIAKVEPVQVKLWDMRVRAAARILEKGVQDGLITRVQNTQETKGGRNWKDHALTWAAVKGKHYNTCLEEILATTQENGERQIEWEFPRERKQIHSLHTGNLGTKDTMKVVWEMRIRDLEEEGWTTTFTDGSGLNLKAAGGFCPNPNNKSNTSGKPTGSKYLGMKSTHFDGELEGIALALENHMGSCWPYSLTQNPPYASWKS